MNNREILYLGGGLVVGVVIGVFAARTHFKNDYERLAQQEIDDVKEHYKILRKEGMETPAEAAKAVSKEYSEAVDSLGYASVEAEEASESEESEVKNIFSNDKPSIPLPARRQSETDEILELNENSEWAYETAHRNTEEPHVISVDEYMLENDHFDKETLSYYQEDDTLCDLNDRPIDDPDSLVGDDSLTKFGVGSKDFNIVYVRNPRIEVDYEVLRDTRSYTEVVLGITDNDSGPRKFREDD